MRQAPCVGHGKAMRWGYAHGQTDRQAGSDIGVLVRTAVGSQPSLIFQTISESSIL